MPKGNSSISRGIAIAKVVATIATSSTGHPQNPVTQLANVQKTNTALSSQQTSISRKSNSASGNK